MCPQTYSYIIIVRQGPRCVTWRPIRIQQLADRKMLANAQHRNWLKSAFRCSHNLKLDGHIIGTRATYRPSAKAVVWKVCEIYKKQTEIQKYRNTEIQKHRNTDRQTEICGIYIDLSSVVIYGAVFFIRKITSQTTHHRSIFITCLCYTPSAWNSVSGTIPWFVEWVMKQWQNN